MHGIRRARLYTVLIITVLLESALFSLVDIGGICPNIMLILVIFAGLYSDWTGALEAGIAGGLLRGAVTTGPIIVSVIMFAIIALFASYFRNKVYRESLSAQAILTFLMGIAFNLMAVFFGFITAGSGPAERGLARPLSFTVIFISLYTALLAPFIFFFLRRFFSVQRTVN